MQLLWLPPVAAPTPALSPLSLQLPTLVLLLLDPPLVPLLQARAAARWWTSPCTCWATMQQDATHWRQMCRQCLSHAWKKQTWCAKGRWISTREGLPDRAAASLHAFCRTFLRLSEQVPSTWAVWQGCLSSWDEESRCRKEASCVCTPRLLPCVGTELSASAMPYLLLRFRGAEERASWPAAGLPGAEEPAAIAGAQPAIHCWPCSGTVTVAPGESVLEHTWGGVACQAGAEMAWLQRAPSLWAVLNYWSCGCSTT